MPSAATLLPDHAPSGHDAARINSLRGEVSDFVSMSWPLYLRRHCIYLGRLVRLSRTETELLSVLLMRRGQIVSKAELVEAIYPDPDASPEWEIHIIQVMVCRLSHKLPGLVQVCHGRGYIVERPSLSRDSDGPRLAETRNGARGGAGPARAEGIARPEPAQNPRDHLSYPNSSAIAGDLLFNSEGRN